MQLWDKHDFSCWIHWEAKNMKCDLLIAVNETIVSLWMLARTCAGNYVVRKCTNVRIGQSTSWKIRYDHCKQCITRQTEGDKLNQAKKKKKKHFRTSQHFNKVLIYHITTEPGNTKMKGEKKRLQNMKELPSTLMIKPCLRCWETFYSTMLSQKNHINNGWISS